MLSESCSLGRERKLGGTFHLRLNTHSSPIANKYREGKVQSTLERELNVPETAVVQAYGTCARSWDWVRPGGLPCVSWRVRVGLRVVSAPVTCLSPRGICQHGFARGQKLVATSLSGGVQRSGLRADRHSRASFFSWCTSWKSSASCRHGELCQGIEPSRCSSLC